MISTLWRGYQLATEYRDAWDQARAVLASGGSIVDAAQEFADATAGQVDNDLVSSVRDAADAALVRVNQLAVGVARLASFAEVHGPRLIERARFALDRLESAPDKAAEIGAAVVKLAVRIESLRGERRP